MGGGVGDGGGEVGRLEVINGRITEDGNLKKACFTILG